MDKWSTLLLHWHMTPPSGRVVLLMFWRTRSLSSCVSLILHCSIISFCSYCCLSVWRRRWLFSSSSISFCLMAISHVMLARSAWKFSETDNQMVWTGTCLHNARLWGSIFCGVAGSTSITLNQTQIRMSCQHSSGCFLISLAKLKLAVFFPFLRISYSKPFVEAEFMQSQKLVTCFFLCLLHTVTTVFLLMFSNLLRVSAGFNRIHLRPFEMHNKDIWDV